jgi:hypothetical protein
MVTAYRDKSVDHFRKYNTDISARKVVYIDDFAYSFDSAASTTVTNYRNRIAYIRLLSLESYPRYTVYDGGFRGLGSEHKKYQYDRGRDE